MQNKAAVPVVGVQMLGNFRDGDRCPSLFVRRADRGYTALKGAAYPLNRSSVALLNARNFSSTDTRAMSSFELTGLSAMPQHLTSDPQILAPHRVYLVENGL